ncbi:glycoside hydrolase superfamily [Morchella snyderi]|nr:glycoside hydrolase superfamily [Morchella snyderi]
MKYSLSTLLFAAAAAVVSASPVANFENGFNMGAQNPDGSCKTTADWTRDFQVVQGWSTATVKYNTFKLYSTNDCDTLKNAVPAAQAVGAKIWAGVWAIDEAKFNAEKAALEYAMQTWGTDWLAGVNVGSESLYRMEIDPVKLAIQIWDVKGMVNEAYKAGVLVGCADTWTSWVNGTNAIVIEASDIIMMNGFPYWQGSTIESAKDIFYQSIAATKAVINGKPFMIGETGWPTGGDNFGSAVPTTENLQTYWKTATCALQADNIPYFFFSTFDEPNRSAGVEQHFGVATSDKALKISLAC